MNPDARTSPELDLWELQQLQQELKDWTFTGLHHIHKSWQFLNAQQALQWHRLARELSDRRGQDCYFSLDHLGSGRIETDVFNPAQGHLTRVDLDMAVMMNAMANYVANPTQDPNPDYLYESIRFLHRHRVCGGDAVLPKHSPGSGHH